jgi:hypothetical protein
MFMYPVASEWQVMKPLSRWWFYLLGLGLLISQMSLTTPIRAAALSYGCNFYQKDFQTQQLASISIGQVNMIAGEELVLRFQSSQNYPANEVEVRWGGVILGRTTVPGTLRIPITVDGSYTLVAFVTDPQPYGEFIMDASCSNPSNVPPEPPNIVCELPGRENAASCGSSVAIFRDGDSLDIYGVNPTTGDGVLTISFLLADMPTKPPTTNQLLASGVNAATGASVDLYLLTTGELQINTTNPDGSPYVYIWNL